MGSAKERGHFPHCQALPFRPTPTQAGQLRTTCARALARAIQRRRAGHRLPRTLARGRDKRSRRGSRARGRGGAAPPLAPPPRPYSVGRPRAQSALCSAAAGAPVCADLEGGGRSSSLLPRGIPSALQPLARRSPSRSPSPSRGPGAAPVSCRECAGARGEAVGRRRPGRVQLRAAAGRRGLAPETGELSVRVLLAGAAASDPRPPGCTLGCHPPLLVCLRCRWLTCTRGVHDPQRPRGS